MNTTDTPMKPDFEKFIKGESENEIDKEVYKMETVKPDFKKQAKKTYKIWFLGHEDEKEILEALEDGMEEIWSLSESLLLQKEKENQELKAEIERLNTLQDTARRTTE